MPSCIECVELKEGKCLAVERARAELKRPLPPAPSGACMLPIVEGYLHFIKRGDRVLEIGCGAWGKVRAHCEIIGAEYQGIDSTADYFAEPSVATRIENLNELSFPDQSFDHVIGSQTMEHWQEHGCSLEWGIYQCFRVLKAGGALRMNVPVHFHGTREFLLGDFRPVESILKRFSSQVRFEKWGNPSGPIPEFFPQPAYSRLRKSPAYVMDIQAVRDQPLPRVQPDFPIPVRLRRWMNYPVSYLFHKLRNRLETSA